MKRSLSQFLFLLLCTLFAWETGTAQERRGKRSLVDTISTTRLQQVIQGNKGKITLVNIWATWCEPCKKEIPALLKLRTVYAKKDFDLILVSADDIENAQTTVSQNLKKLGVDFTTYIKQDTTDEAFMMGLNPDWSGALPTSFLYDKRGKLRDMMIGERTYERLRQAVERILIQ